MHHLTRPWLPFVLSFTVDPGQSPGGGGEVVEPEAPKPGPPAGKTFSEDDLERIVGERLNRERAQQQAETRELRAKAAQLDAIEAEKQTESERAAAAVAKAQKAAEEAKAEAVRYRAAAAAGIDPDSDDFSLIGSGPEADVLARAKRLGELLSAEREWKAAQEQPPQQQAKPRPQLRPGAAPVEEAGRPSSVDAAREAALRRGVYQQPAGQQ